MSLPPSALYPHSGVAYNELETCLLQLAGGPVLTGVTANAYLPLDAGTGTQATGLFIQLGRNVGLKANRTVPPANTDPRVGALVNSSSVPIAISGSVVVASTVAWGAGATYVQVGKQPVNTDIANAQIVGRTTVSATDTIVDVPFSVILKPLDSLFVQNGGLSAGTLNAQFWGVRATSLYGNIDTLQADYIPA